MSRFRRSGASSGERGSDPSTTRRVIASTLLAAWVAMLFHLTLFRYYHPGAAPNFVPLLTIRHDVRAGGDEFRINIMGNLGVFAPIGFLLPTVLGRRSSAVRVVGRCLGLSLAIEALQWGSGVRVADVDDLILNTIGGTAGYLSWWMGRWWFATGPPPDQNA